MNAVEQRHFDIRQQNIIAISADHFKRRAAIVGRIHLHGKIKFPDQKLNALDLRGAVVGDKNPEHVQAVPFINNNGGYACMHYIKGDEIDQAAERESVISVTKGYFLLFTGRDCFRKMVTVERFVSADCL